MDITKRREQELVELCRALIKAPSNSGEEGAAVEVMRRYCARAGFDGTDIDDYGTCVGHISGGGGGKRLLFDAHIDTVPVPRPEDWAHPPYGAAMEDGKIYGRGASDMKGALAAMLAAASWYAEDCGHRFAGDLFVAGAVHEECFEGIASRLVSAAVRPDCVVIGEASQLKVQTGQRGRAEIVLETFGVPAHSSNPQEGVNAACQMLKAAGEIEKLPFPRHPALGEGILVLTDIKSSPYPAASVLPDYCRATFDRRLLPGETRESVLVPLEEVLRCLAAEDTTFRARVSYAKGEMPCYTGATIEGERFFPAWLRADGKEDVLVREICGALRAANLPCETGTYSFCTNGSHYAGEAGIATIGLGPSLETLAHTVDEYIACEQLLAAAHSYYTIIKTLLPA